MRRFDKFCDKVRYNKHVRGSKYYYHWDEESGLIWREFSDGIKIPYAVTDGEEWFNLAYMLKHNINRKADFE